MYNAMRRLWLTVEITVECVPVHEREREGETEREKEEERSEIDLCLCNGLNCFPFKIHMLKF